MTTKKQSPDAKHRLLVGTAMLGVLCSGYGRRAYAACTGAAGVYACSGALTTNQILPPAPNAFPLVATGDATFSVDVTTVGGNALTLSGTNGISFIDNSGGAITGGSNPPSPSNGIGIDANNSAGTGDVYIHTGSSVAISAGGYAVYAHNGGSGSVSITTLGTVTSTHQGGIKGDNGFGLAGLTINAATVTGYSTGINGINFQGAMSITTTGLITANSTSGIGIFAANNSASTTNLTITTAAVTGGATAINAQNLGSGFLKITSTGTLTGTAGNAVIVSNSGSYAKLNLADVNAPGGFRAISANTATTGGDMTITTGNVTALDEGIYAQNHGTGSVTITTGAVTTTGPSGNGIIVTNSNTAKDVTINVASVSSFGQGINVLSQSTTGAVTITATGGVTGSGDKAIYARAYGTSLTIHTQSVSGGTYGIKALNDGTGPLSITSTGTVSASGGTGQGINAYNMFGQSLTINAVGVSGASGGVTATNKVGPLAITSTGTVSATSGSGIYAKNQGSSTSLTINAVNVSAQGFGIKASNNGSGAVSITSTGTVSSIGFSGIFAYNEFGTDLSGNGITISAKHASGLQEGIYAKNLTAGALTVKAYGAVSGTGPTSSGIFARNGGPGQTSITVYHGAVVQGVNNGVYTVSTSGSVSITNSGTIQNSSGASTDLAIKTGGGATTILNNGTINGAVTLADPPLPNSFTNNGTWNTAGAVNSFGGADTLTNAATGVIVAANSGASSAAFTSFVGLATFTNAGQLTMHNGFAGDQVSILGSFVGQSGGSMRSTPFLTTARPPPTVSTSAAARAELAVCFQCRRPRGADDGQRH
jgi:hypothetical protein